MTRTIPAGMRESVLLLVDDEPEILTALQDLFEGDYKILKTTSPLSALEILNRERDIGVILSDQRMPGMTGDVFLAQARAVSDAEAILLTGYADLKAVIDAVNLGQIGGYAHKPWDDDVLKQMVAKAFERHRLSRALALERSLLAGLMENSPDAVSFKDAAGRFTRLNAVKADQLGVSIEDCLGRKEAEFLPPEVAAVVEHGEGTMLQQCRTVQTDEERVDAEGAQRYIFVSRTPFASRTGGVESFVVIERDVTEEKLKDARLRQADKMQALGTLAGGVAHDFNNLLAAVLGSIELAQTRVVEDSRLQYYLQNAMAAAKRGAALTRRLLSFSRPHQSLSETVDPAQLTRGLEGLLGRTLGAAITVSWRLDEGVWPIAVDTEQFELGVLNLCINARDAMPAGGSLTISCQNRSIGSDDQHELPAGDYVVVCVADTGVGMSADVLSRVFEPFFTTKDIGKGTGLGLFIVYSFLRQSGGTVNIRSVLGEGTAIELFFPRSSPDLVKPKKETPGISADGKPANVLLVDDDEDVRRATAALLTDLGHAVTETESSQEALDILSGKSAIEVLVADYAMPGMTGLQLADAARRRRPDLRVLLITGGAALEEPPSDYAMLRKPFEQRDLAAKIRALVPA